MGMSDYIELKKALKYCVFNICEELTQTQKKGGVVELEGDEIALLYSSDGIPEQAEANARKFAEEIKSTVKQYLNTTATIAIGGVHQGISCIRSSYQEARSLFSFRHFIGKNKVYSLANIGFSARHDKNVLLEGNEHELCKSCEAWFSAGCFSCH